MWILIIIMMAPNGSLATTTAEFTSQAMCQSAATQVSAYKASQGTEGTTEYNQSQTSTICVEK